MIINNIKVGQVIKNYKEFCELIGEKTKTSNSKKAQLKEWARYIKWHKDGNKFIIDEIYNIPLPKPIHKGNNNKYIEEIKDILTYYIYNQIKINNDNVVTLSISELINILGMANNTYSIGTYKKRELSDILHIEMTAIYNFYSSTRSEFKKIIERALKSLKSKSILIYQDAFMVANIKNGKLHKKPANDEEYNSILNTQNEMLKLYNMESFKDLFLAGKKVYKKFMDDVNKELSWDFYYPAYKLICGKKAVAREYKEIIDRKKQLNNKSIERCKQLFKIIDKNSNESKLISDLISLKNYDPNIDDLVKIQYQKNKSEYFRKLNEEHYKINKIEEDYKNKEEVSLSDLMKYKCKSKRDREHEEYWHHLLNEIDTYDI